jgi:hypothetical protein
MDEKSLHGLISNLFPDGIEGLLTQGDQPEGEQHNRAVELLKTAAGQAGGPAGEEINNFLNGSGPLFDTTRAAAAHGSVSASTTIAGFLEKQLNLSPALARILAPLLVNLLPGIGKQSGSTAAAKPKPHRKEPKTSTGSKPKKPKTSASAKPASAAKPKKPKASASSKPKKPASSTATGPKKPKTSSSKKPVAKPKRTGRTEEIPES